MTNSGERGMLAASILSALASRAMTAEELGARMGCATERVAEVVVPLAVAGWVRLPGADGRYSYAHPSPDPTLQEVLEAEREDALVDDCVLRPGMSCDAFAGRTTCAGHADWTATLSGSALLAAPVAAGSATRLLRGADARRIVGDALAHDDPSVLNDSPARGDRLISADQRADLAATEAPS